MNELYSHAIANVSIFRNEQVKEYNVCKNIIRAEKPLLLWIPRDKVQHD